MTADIGANDRGEESSHGDEARGGSSKMATAKAVLGVANDLVAAGIRQAQMAKMQLEAHRLESKIDEEKDRIGHALYPLLEHKLLQVEEPDVAMRMKAISELYLQLAAKKAEIDATNRPEPEDSEGGGPAKQNGAAPARSGG